MGLDWIATDNYDNMGENEMFRGKTIANDPNLQECEYECYGEFVEGGGNDGPMMSASQRLTIMKAIKKVYNLPKEEIKLGGWSDYAEWRGYMKEAFHFLQDNKKIVCWY